MRLFRRTRDTKTSVIRREAVSAVAEAAPVPLPRPTRPSSAPVAPVTDQPSPNDQPIKSDVYPVLAVPPSPPSYEGLEDSDVFLCQRDDAEAAAAAEVKREVTLFVHGWHNVEPGLLSWTFPSLRAALDAVQRMKNAIGWCVVSGTDWSDLDTARASGAVLVEQLA